jgi:uncharacterized protein (TIRG00374 family)
LTNSSTSSISASPSSNGSHRFGWTAALGLVIAALLIWWALHDVSAGEVWSRLRNVRLVPFTLSIVVATLMFPLRTIRWQYLLRLEGEALPFIPLWHATAIGFMSTNLLPARAGEFARAYAARRLTGVRFTTAFASIAVERVLDGITLVAALVVAIWAGGFGGDTAVSEDRTLGSVVRGAGFMFLLLLVVALAVVHWPRLAIDVTGAASRRILPDRWSRGLTAAVEGLVSGLDVLRSPRRFAAAVFWSLVVWIAGAASFWLGMLAFELDVPWSAALMLQSLLAFGIAIQFSPGFFGQWEALCRVALPPLYGVSVGATVSFALGFHLGGFIPITLLGLWSLSRAHLHLADLRRGGLQDEDGVEQGSRA